MYKLISVIIPTKDRYETLFESISAMRNHIISEKIEFVIHDNTYDNTKALEYLDEINDNRIVYHHCKESINVVENFNKAFSISNGEYLIFIGDDDFVNPYIIDMLEMLSNHKIECLIYPRANYYWSNVLFDHEFDFFEKSSMQIQKEYSLELKELDSSEQFNLLLSKGGIYLFNMPQAYHGIVKRSVLSSIAEEYGNVFLSVSPDMSIAVTLSFVLKKYHYLDFPMSITGASYSSAAGMGRRREHSATLDKLPKWLPSSMKENWYKDNPKIWNGFTVYVHSILEISNIFDKKVKLNYLNLYKKVIEDNIWDISYVLNSLNNGPFTIKDKLKMIIYGVMSYTIKRIFFMLPKYLKNYFISKRRGFKTRTHIQELNSVNNCMLFLKNFFFNVTKQK